MPTPAVVLLLALSQPRDQALDDLLGFEAAKIVRLEIIRRARRFAAAVAPQAAFEANSFGAAEAALEGHDGPVIFVATDVPGIDGRVADGALEDLADGIGVVFGSTYDGSPYLVAVPRFDDGVVGLLDVPREEMFAQIGRAGGGVGMVRSERRLVSPADARAFAADPLLPLELALPLAAGLDVRSRR